MSKLNWDKWISNDGESSFYRTLNIVQINTPQALIQAVGYAKSVLSCEHIVFYRGQCSFYPSLIPYLFRDITKDTDKTDIKINLALSEKIKRLSTLINGSIKNELKGVYPPAIEGLLQHYGVPTRYLDFVDNIWVALWFASHKRLTAKGVNFSKYVKSKSEFSYVYIMKFGKTSDPKEYRKLHDVKIDELQEDMSNGIFLTNKSFQIIDLRLAVGSNFLRPHAQHGIVVRRYGDITTANYDFSDSIECILRIKTQDALDWLGTGSLSQESYMFPSPFYDIGYRTLHNIFPQNAGIGEIDYVW